MSELMTLLSILAKLFGAAGAGHRQTAVVDGCPSGLVEADGAFSDAVTALGAKLARAEGPSMPGEFDRFTEIFRPQPAAEADVRRLYRLARQTTLGFEGYARKLARRYGHCPIILERVLDGLFQLALADGVVSERETEYLQRVADALGVTPAVYRAVRARRLGLSEEDPYRVLEVDPAAPDDVVRAAWKKLLIETHPDRAVARGLPRELVERAQVKAQAINAAFDRVMHERRSGFAVGVA
jgi:DnaJ like chaperone protein